MTIKNKILGIILIIPFAIFIFIGVYLLSMEYEFIRAICVAMISIIVVFVMFIMAVTGYILITDS